MSRKKNKNKKNKNPQPHEAVNVETVRTVLAEGKTKEALALAKQLIKESPSLETESCLAAVYQARIRELQADGLVSDANNLIEIARQRCSNFKKDFNSLSGYVYHFPLSREDVSRLVTLLQNPANDEINKDRLLDILKYGLSDLRYLIEASGISEENALKQDAIVVWNAFAAVTNEMDESQRRNRLARLSSVSRHSPLALWCLFIRALEAYHAFDDALVGRLLEKIPDRCALAPAKQILTSLLKKLGPPPGLSSRATRLVWKAIDPETPTAQWLDLMRTFESRNKKGVRDKIGKILQSSWTSSPFLLRAASRAINEKIDETEINLDRQVYEDLNKAYEKIWGEVGILLNVLDVIKVIGMDEPLYASQRMENAVNEWSDLLTDKEKSVILIRAAAYALIDESDVPKPFFFGRSHDRVDHDDSIRLCQKAIKYDPQPEYFEKLLFLMRKENRKAKEIEELLNQWRKRFPNDCVPLVYLFEDAEQRGVLQKALKFLEEAERLDHLNPKVRNARQRLVWRMAIKHVKQRKFHLAQRDMKHVQSLEMNPGNQALFNSLERFLLLCQNESDPGAGEVDPIFSALLIRHLENTTNAGLGKHIEKVAPLYDLDDGHKLNVYYDFRDALIAMGESPFLPLEWFERFPRWIAKAERITDELLLRISRSVITNGMPVVAMASTARGLQNDNHHLHEFLFYRAMALLKEDINLDEEVEECLCAAITLCRKNGDYAIERQAVDALQKIKSMYLGSSFLLDEEEKDFETELSPKEVARVLKRERKRTVDKKGKWTGSKPARKPFGFTDKLNKNIMSTIGRLMKSFKSEDEDEDDLAGNLDPDDFEEECDPDDFEEDVDKLQTTFWPFMDDDEEKKS